ncbi:hypothetical protein CBS101457_006764 [Exobasidium rhododendri]|nr:hypothetical protein CBS101457_006764 [Exobasidium rhododendri]
MATSSNTSSASRSFTSSTSTLQDPPRLHLAPLAAKDPLLFDVLRPRPESAFVALAHRLKLISPKTDEQTRKLRVKALIQACTHPSFTQLISRTLEQYGDQADAGTGKGVTRNRREEESSVEGIEANWFDSQYLETQAESLSNEALSALGNSLLGLVAAEHLHLRYPNLPTRVLKAALSAYVGPNTLADVAAELGIAAKGIVRWDRQARKADEDGPKGRPLLVQRQKEKLLSRDVHVEAMRGIVAVIFQEQGLPAARVFVETHFLSRMIPLLDLLKFNNPKRTLSDLCQKVDRERPQSRMIAETGRLSINPIFVVGVYSGTEKLGEGTGSAIRMAEYRAAEDALRRFYLSERPIAEISLPSVTLDGNFTSSIAEEAVEDGRRTVWDIDADRKQTATPFQPSEIGQSEVIFGSKG